jgi:hypothetical protein
MSPDPSFAQYSGLLLLCFVFVTAATNELAGENTRIGLNHNPVRFANLQMRDRDFGPYEPRCAFKEHQTDGDAVQLLWANGAGRHVSFPSMLLVAFDLAFPKGIKRFAKSISAQGIGVSDVANPIFRPPDPVNKPTCLTKREIYSCNPGSLLLQLGFEARKIPPWFNIPGTQNFPIEIAGNTGQWLPAAWTAREVDP